MSFKILRNDITKVSADAIVKMNIKQFDILFDKMKFRFPKEEHLIPIWVKVISNDVLNRLKN